MLPPVFATPVMIMAMENAALNAIRAYLDPGESAVGTAVNVRHLAATPVGHLVSAEAEVTKVDGRQIEFTVRAGAIGRLEITPGSTSSWRDSACFARIGFSTSIPSWAPFSSAAVMKVARIGCAE
jgi:predicted thioesterase